MVQFFLNIYDYLKRKRSLCFGLLAGITILLIVMTAALKYNENIYDFLPISGKQQRAMALYQDITGGQRVIALFSANPSATAAPANTEEQITQAVDTFANIITSSHTKHISEVMSQIDFEELSGITDFIYGNIPLMLSDSDYTHIEQIISTPQGVEEQLSQDVTMMMLPSTGFISSNIGKDPLNIFSSVMDRLQQALSSMPVEYDNGYIYTPGRKYAVVMMTSPYGAMESANNNLLVNYIDSVAQETSKVLPNVKISFTGAPVIAVGNAVRIKKDSQWAVSIAVTLIIFLLIYSFRKTKNLLFIGVTILFGWLFAMGFISVIRSDVSLIVLGIGSVIIGIAVNYPLHFVAHTESAHSMRQLLKEMVPPLLIGNITTVGAFAALMPLNSPALRDLGFFAAFMLIGTILFVLIFLPHLVKTRQSEQTERLSFGRLSAASPEKHPWLLWITIILTIVFAYYSTGVSFDTNIQNINYISKEQKQLLADLNVSAGILDTSNLYLVAEGESWDKALSQRAAVTPLLNRLKEEGKIKGYSNVNSLIGSKTEQENRIKKWEEFWKENKEKTLYLLKEKAPQYGFNSEAFREFEDILNKEYTALNFEDFASLRSLLLTSSFAEVEGRCCVVDKIEADGKEFSYIEDAINDNLKDDGYAFDFVGLNSAMANSLSNDFNYIGFACGLIVFLFLWLSFGRLELSLLAFLPMAMGWLWILGIMSLLGMSFNIVNVILATFIFGQGDDYTIFITEGLIDEYAYRKKVLASFKNSIIISALIMFIGMGSLIVAKHPAVHSLAEVTIIGMFSVVFMAWIVPPAIFKWLVRTKEGVRQNPITIEQVLRTLFFYITYPVQRLFNTAYIPGVKLLIDSKIKEALRSAQTVCCITASGANKQTLLSRFFLKSINPSLKFAEPDASATDQHPLTVTLYGLENIHPNKHSLIARGTVAIEASATENANSYRNTHFFHHYLIYKYIYKGISFEHETKKMLRKHNDFSKWIDGKMPSIVKKEREIVSVIGEKHGQFSIMFALVHPEVEVHAFCYNAEDAALVETAANSGARGQFCIKNIKVHISENEKTAEENANALNSSLINLSEILS